MMLTLSEGVDLSSNVKGQQENTQSSFEQFDILDDRDSPPSYENLPLESPTSQLYSPIQYERIPDTFSFSPTPSPVLSSAAVDIYEQYPALSQNDSPSPYSPHFRSPEFQGTTSEHVHDEEIPSLPLNDLPTSPAQVTETVSSKWQAESSSHNIHSSITLAYESPTNVADDRDSRSVTCGSISVSPVIQPQSSPSISLGPSAYIFPEALEDLPPLPQTENSSPIIQAQEISITIPDGLPPLQFYPALSEGRSPTPENAPISPITEAQLVTSTPPSEPIPAYHEPVILEDTPPTVDRHALAPIDEGQEILEEASLQLSYSSSPKVLVEVSGELPLPPVELQQSPAQQQLLEGNSAHSQRSSLSLDPILAPESLPALPESPAEEFEQPTQELSSAPDISHDLPALGPSELGFQSHGRVESGSSLDGPPSPSVSEPAPEYSQPLLKSEPSSPRSLLLVQEVAPPELPQLYTTFLFNDISRFPQAALNGPSSPKPLSPVEDESISYAASDPVAVVVPDEKSIERSASGPTSLVTVPERGFSPLPLSAPVSPSVQPEVPTNVIEIPINNPLTLHEVAETVTQEPTIEIVPLLSRSSSPQLTDLPHNDLSPVHEPETPMESPDLPLSDPVSPYPTFEASVRSVDSRSPSIAEDENESLTGVPLNNSTSSPLAIIPDDLPQLPPSDPNSPYDMPETMFEFSDFRDRGRESLSPILEEDSEPSASRSPSIAAKDESYLIQPMSSPASPDMPATVPNGLIEVPQEEPSSPMELSPKEPSEIHLHATEPEPAPLTDAVSPATVTDDFREMPFELSPPALELPLDQFSTVPPEGNPASPEISVIALNDRSEPPQGRSLSPVLELPLEESFEIYPAATEPEVAPSTEEVSQTVVATVADLAELPFDEPSTSVLDSPLEQSFESQPTVEHEVESTVDLVPSSVEYTHSDDHEELFGESPSEEETLYHVPELSPEQPAGYDVQQDTQASHSIHEFTSQQELEVRSVSRHSSVEGLSRAIDDLPGPESVPLPEEISTPLTSSPVTTAEHAVAEMPETDAELSINGPTPEYTFPAEVESEYASRRSSIHGVQLSPTLEIAEDSLTELENLPLSEDIPTSPPSIPEERVEIETAGMGPELPTNDRSLEYTLPEESEVESITHRFSIEGFQLPSGTTSHADPYTEPESLPSHDDIPIQIPPILVEPTGPEIPESGEVASTQNPVATPEINAMHMLEPAVESQQLEGAATPHQPIYDTLPPVQIEVGSKS